MSNFFFFFKQWVLSPTSEKLKWQLLLIIVYEADEHWTVIILL